MLHPVASHSGFKLPKPAENRFNTVHWMRFQEFFVSDSKYVRLLLAWVWSVNFSLFLLTNYWLHFAIWPIVRHKLLAWDGRMPTYLYRWTWLQSFISVFSLIYLSLAYIKNQNKDPHWRSEYACLLSRVNPGSVFRTPTLAAFITLIEISVLHTQQPWPFAFYCTISSVQRMVIEKNFHILCVIAWCAVVRCENRENAAISYDLVKIPLLRWCQPARL